MVWNQEGWFLQLHSYLSRLLWLFGVFSVSIRIVKISNKGIINQIQSSQPFQTGIWLPMAFLAHSCLQGWGSVSMLSGKTDTEDEPVKTWMLCSGSKMTFTLYSLHIFWPLQIGVICEHQAHLMMLHVCAHVDSKQGKHHPHSNWSKMKLTAMSLQTFILV